MKLLHNEANLRITVEQSNIFETISILEEEQTTVVKIPPYIQESEESSITDVSQFLNNFGVYLTHSVELASFIIALLSADLAGSMIRFTLIFKLMSILKMSSIDYGQILEKFLDKIGFRFLKLESE